jgi:hypothetical protein
MRQHYPADPPTEYIRRLLSRGDPDCLRCGNPITFCICGERPHDPPGVVRESTEQPPRAKKAFVIPPSAEPVQESRLIDGECYVSIAEVARRTGFSRIWLRNSARDGSLEQRGLQVARCPRSAHDKRPPIYVREADLPKLVRRPKGRFRANQSE